MAENLFIKRFGNKYEFFSAGISPIPSPNMDPRSLEFLKDNNVIHSFHNPKKINKKMLSYFDKFLAVDFYVLNQLNITYPKYRHKFLSLTKQFSNTHLIDPYQMQTNEYNRTMNEIKYVVENINLDEV